MARGPNRNADLETRQRANAAAIDSTADGLTAEPTPRESWTRAVWHSIASGDRLIITPRHVTWGLVIGWTVVAAVLLVLILPVMI
ncbi:MAG: hypothetical protein KF889_03660 [Alphaproteobacteria bacterium]|nr:hypothetical protein [Alphaproteobacteria bacterium]MCW5742007.1 hypothetical protein [Alphaproteobacteria bacterium]